MQTAKTFKTAWLFAMLSIAGWATTQAQTTATWIGPSSGGEWNTGANWDTVAPPLASTTNALIGRSTNVDYNLPMVAASFGSLTNRGVLNINTNGFNSGSIIMTIPTAIAKLFVNTGGVLNVTGDLGFCSNSIVSMAAGSSVTISGTNIIGSGVNGGLAGATVGAFGSMTNIGGNLTASATALNPGNASIGTSCRLVIEGGINNLGAYSAQRSPGGANAPPALGSDGLVISNGFVNTTSISVGNNAHGIMYLVGGTVTNTGAFTLANATVTRPARFHQVGGLFVQPDPNIVTMSGSADTVYSVLGGTNIVGGFRFTSAFVYFTNAGTIYVGSAGISTNGATLVATTNIVSLNNGGLFGATTNWVGSVSMKFNTGGSGQFTFQAADMDGNPFNIQIAGMLSGSGTLKKTGGGTLLLGTNNTYVGTTLVNGGTLALDVNGSLANLTTIVGSGATFDVSAVNGGFVLNNNQTLSGSGVVTGAVSVASGATIDPGSNALTGTLTFSSSVTETGGAVNHFDLTGAPNPDNDLVIIAGDLNASATNKVDITGLSLVSRTNYTLIQYGGDFNGGLTNFALTSTSFGVLTNDATAKTISFIPAAPLRAPTNTVWIGNPVNTNWNNANSTNWLIATSGALEFFVPGDSVRFTDAGASNSPVNIAEKVAPASIVVDSQSNYVFASTSGGLIDDAPSLATSLTKTNTGTLTILTTNTYSGVTTIGGGVLEVSQLANGGLASAIGAAAGDPANLLIGNNATLRYAGGNGSTDHGATFTGTNAIFDVTSSATTLTLSGTLTGSSALAKIGAGTLTLSGVNNYSGGTVITAGTIRANPASAIGTNTLTLNGGAIAANFRFAGDAQTLGDVLNVVGTNNSITVGGNDTVNTMTGNGTVNVEGTGAQLFTFGAADMSAFNGTIYWDTITTNRFFPNSGTSINAPSTTFDLGIGSGVLINRDGGNYHIGALQSSSSSTQVRGSNNSGSANTTYYIGEKGVDTIFAGVIRNGTGGNGATTHLVKLGGGRLRLTGQSTYTGTTTVSNGVLALANNPDNGMEGSISASAIITLGAGTILDVSGRSDGTLQLNAGQILEGYGTINGAIDASYGGSFSPGGGSAGGIGTLTITGDISIGTGTDWMKLDRSASPNSDRLVSSGGSITHLGDSLVVTNIGAPLQAGDTFTLFTNATTGYSYYTSITLPSSYIWNTNQLAANGTITVISVLPHPSVTKADFSNFAGGSLTLNATNGVPNATVTILSSTNLASPFGSWTVVTNTTFDANGNLKDPNTGDPGLIITNLVNDQPTRFYLLKTQ